jgi:hypothetical protein
MFILKNSNYVILASCTVLLARVYSRSIEEEYLILSRKSDLKPCFNSTIFFLSATAHTVSYVIITLYSTTSAAEQPQSVPSNQPTIQG